jgi:hypothetical protein
VVPGDDPPWFDGVAEPFAGGMLDVLLQRVGGRVGHPGGRGQGDRLRPPRPLPTPVTMAVLPSSVSPSPISGASCSAWLWPAPLGC